MARLPEGISFCKTCRKRHPTGDMAQLGRTPRCKGCELKHAEKAILKDMIAKEEDLVSFCIICKKHKRRTSMNQFRYGSGVCKACDKKRKQEAKSIVFTAIKPRHKKKIELEQGRDATIFDVTYPCRTCKRPTPVSKYSFRYKRCFHCLSATRRHEAQFRLNYIVERIVLLGNGCWHIRQYPVRNASVFHKFIKHSPPLEGNCGDPNCIHPYHGHEHDFYEYESKIRRKLRVYLKWMEGIEILDDGCWKYKYKGMYPGPRMFSAFVSLRGEQKIGHRYKKGGHCLGCCNPDHWKFIGYREEEVQKRTLLALSLKKVQTRR